MISHKHAVWLLLFTYLFMAGLPEAFAVVFTDDDCETHQISAPKKRIISLYTAHTENLIELGLNKEIVGASAPYLFPQHPEIISFSHRDNMEKFIAAKPDLVLIRPMISRLYPQFVKDLKKLGIQVISLQPTSISEMYTYWHILGQLTGHETQATLMKQRFTAGLEQIQNKVNRIAPDKRPQVYFEAIHKQMKTFSPSSISIFCLEQAGGRNIAADATPRFNSNIAGYGKEKLLSKGEKIDIFLAQHGRMNRVTISMIIEEPGFSAIRAIRNNKVFLIDEKLVSRPTVHLLQGIQIIHTYLYENQP